MRGQICLFSYGTLRDRGLQRVLFGREVDTLDDVLSGFVVSSVRIADPDVIAKSGTDLHPILRRGTPDQAVAGSVLLLTDAEIAAADSYETANYRRIPVTLVSGRSAYAYVHADDTTSGTGGGTVDVVEPNRDLLDQLLPVARRIFEHTFKSRFETDAFEAFCDAVYLPGGSMSRDFDDPDVQWRVVVACGDPVGYAKLTPLRAPALGAAPRAMELQQLYLLPERHGTGVADRLMKWAIATARASKAPELYLTVFDDNHRAKRFYARHGFEEVGSCTFEMGGRLFDDRIWLRQLQQR